MSKAVKCPSLGTFLAGMKKIQEFISHEQNLIELCNNNKKLSDSFKSVFADFFRLDSEVSLLNLKPIILWKLKFNFINRKTSRKCLKIQRIMY